MDKIIKFLNENGLQYCATIGLDGKPKVRPFKMMYANGENLIYCTGAYKKVYRELNANPNLEICVSTMKKWIRITGEVEWLDNIEIKKRILALSPLVASIYKTADNPDLVAMTIKNATAVIMDFTKKEPEVIEFAR